MKNILQFNNISKKYDKVEALIDISFSIPNNSIFGILGANGSGKSTFMKIIPGLINNWTGSIMYNNKLIKKNSNILKTEFGYLIESPSFYEYISGRKNLEMFSRMSNSKSNNIDYVLELVDLSNRAEDKVSAYSYGMKQRLGIAQALIHNPKVIVLDEPNNGLDPNGIYDMMKIIKRLNNEGKTICLSTHNLKDVEELCTDFTIFNNGKNSKVLSMESQFISSTRWSIISDNADMAIKAINDSSEFNLVSRFNNTILIDSKSKDTPRNLLSLFNKINIYKISKESNLIEYFNND